MRIRKERDNASDADPNTAAAEPFICPHGVDQNRWMASCSP
ncbi:hypothetical protein L195_g035703 [Trifolium pratense]|uniref:Uncharacterized protein n=1 Tax=Trifolium pratense TaxID=57577 RepID=A0A2K3LMF1_TRIPR|nr:hypothetical protein L195_g035703 [Trifolium pratense]